uniref:Uncharacterized protein n=1 Tax=viral metagenome TaxID=1070528 RepID=A0A6C0CSX6_9ZZZZ
MNTTSSSSFMSISNLRTLITIFENFFKDKYRQYSFPRSLNLKEVIYETMTKIDQNKEYNNLTKTELNKITLSIVKNVVKNKLEVVDRPTMNDGKKGEIELNKQFEALSESRREVMFSPPPTTKSEPTDTALSDSEFLESLKNMELMRDSIDQNGSVDQNIADIFKNNLLSNPKDLFSSLIQKEAEPIPEMKEIVQERSDFYIKPEKKPDLLKKYICIDSRERSDFVIDPFHYTIQFEESIRNISSVTLTYVLFNPTINGIDDLYVNLQIDEFNQDKIVSTNAHLKNAFAQLPIQGDRGVYDNALNERITRDFVIPLSALNKLTISFVKFDGTYLETIGEHFIKLEVEYFNSIGGDLDLDPPNLNSFQNTLQEEIFMANDELENMNEEVMNQEEDE